jgi:hypothetical protein
MNTEKINISDIYIMLFLGRKMLLEMRKQGIQDLMLRRIISQKGLDLLYNKISKSLTKDGIPDLLLNLDTGDLTSFDRDEGET